jgi:hypothetical protein
MNQKKGPAHKSGAFSFLASLHNTHNLRYREA